MVDSGPAVAIGAASVVALFFGATGLYVSRHADPDELQKVFDDGLTNLLATGSVGLVISIALFVVAARQ